MKKMKRMKRMKEREKEYYCLCGRPGRWGVKNSIMSYNYCFYDRPFESKIQRPIIFYNTGT
jgi:hypothetical protein